MIEQTGIPSPELIEKITPDATRRAKGPVAVVECFRRIPCNPCYTACPAGAMKPMADINELPEVDFSLCTGCGLCLSRCPGLAIFIVDESVDDTHAIVRIPYEFTPLPAEGDSVTAMNREGTPVCGATVHKVQDNKNQNHTPVVWLRVPKEYSMEVRFFRKQNYNNDNDYYVDSDDTLICRCEELTLGELRELIKKGMHTVDEIKRASRAGMGPCQGRTCRQLIMQELSRATGKSIAEIEMPTFRPPVTAVRLGMLLEGEEEVNKL